MAALATVLVVLAALAAAVLVAVAAWAAREVAREVTRPAMLAQLGGVLRLRICTRRDRRSARGGRL